MMMKSGLVKDTYFEIPPRAKPFSNLLIYFIKGRVYPLKYKFSKKIDLVCTSAHEGDSILLLVYYVCKYPKGPVRTKISPIFNFEYTNEK